MGKSISVEHQALVYLIRENQKLYRDIEALLSINRDFLDLLVLGLRE